MEYKKKLSRYKEEIIPSNLNVNHKQEMIDLQNKYLQTMKETQKSFEVYKFQKEEETKRLRKERDEALVNYQKFYDMVNKLKEKNELDMNNEGKNFQIKFQSIKNVLSQNEELNMELTKIKQQYKKLKNSFSESKSELSLEYKNQKFDKDQNENNKNLYKNKQKDYDDFKFDTNECKFLYLNK